MVSKSNINIISYFHILETRKTVRKLIIKNVINEVEGAGKSL